MARYSNPFVQYFDNDGNPLVGGKLYFYEPGTTTPKDTYSDSGLTTPNSNPVEFDANGRIDDIFLDGIYKVVLTDSGDNVIKTADPVGGTDGGQWDAWLNDSTYNLADIVKGSDDGYYISQVNNNQGVDPTTDDGTSWISYEPYVLAGEFVTGGGIADAYTATAVSPRINPNARLNGFKFRLIAPASNTGACTLDFGLGADDIKLSDGTTDPAPNDIVLDKENTFIDRVTYYELVRETVSVTPNVAKAGQNWSGIALTGADLTALNIQGTSPQADIYPDGTIVGSSSLGNFTLHPNGNLECRHQTGTITSSTAIGSLFRTNLQSLTFPIEFDVKPTISFGTETIGTGIGWASGGAHSATAVEFYIVSYVSGAQNQFTYIAKGRAA